MKRIQCPCCGYFTFLDDDCYYFEFCEVCGWQFDLSSHLKPDSIGANHISLNDARENFKKYGVSKIRLLGSDDVRPPLKEELPENNN